MNPDLRNLGIEVQGAIEEAGWDYELLYLSIDRAQGLCELTLEADEKRVRLPRRIVIGGTEESSLNSVCAFSNPLLTQPENELAILRVYDDWIQFLLQRRELNSIDLSFFFEQQPMAESHWKRLDSKPSYVSGLFPLSGAASALRDGMSTHAKAISLWRHIRLSEFWDSVIKDKPNHSVIHYQQCTYGDQFFAYLSAMNPQRQDFQAQYLLRQIIEMALCRVVIIDERIAQTVAAKTNVKLLEKSLAHILAWMGIWVVGRVEFQENGTTMKVRENGHDVDASFDIGTAPTAENGLVTLVVDHNKEKGFQVKVSLSEGAQYFPQTPSKIELLTTHQTILDGKFKNPLQSLLGDELWGEKWMLGLKPQVLFVYSHSGRGHPRELLPRNAPFLEYSFLQTHILSQPSKFFFVQLALSSKEGRN